jgi:Skp family chaperone for outer membrane proteins
MKIIALNYSWNIFLIVVFISVVNQLQAQNNIKTAYINYASVLNCTPEKVDLIRYQKERQEEYNILSEQYEATFRGVFCYSDTGYINALSKKMTFLREKLRNFEDTVYKSFQIREKNLPVVAARRIQAWVKNVAKEHQISFIFKKDSSVYYFDDKVMDITQAVIEQDTTVYEWVEEMPTFVSGNSGFYKYVRENFYTNTKDVGYIEEAGCYSIKVIFIVEKDGRIADLHFKFRNQIVPNHNSFVMPNWKVGKHNGYTKRVRMVIPMIIRVK